MSNSYKLIQQLKSVNLRLNLNNENILLKEIELRLDLINKKIRIKEIKYEEII